MLGLRTKPMLNITAKKPFISDNVTLPCLSHKRNREEFGTKARSVMTQYIPTKSHKFGIKLWVLVEAVSGYIIHFFPYRGRRYEPVPNGEMQGTH
jgi:hypothetical protein